MPAKLFAQDLTVNAAIDSPQAYLGQNLTLQVTIEGAVSGDLNPELPPLSGFMIYQSGTSQNFSMINGRTSASLTYNYTLVPQKSGNFTIGAIKVKFRGKEYLTAPISLKVLSKAPPSAPTPVGTRSPQAPAGNQGRILFATAHADKNTVYVDQQVTYTFCFYRTVNLLSSPQFTEPVFTGFINRQLKPYTSYETTLDGRYAHAEETSYALFPTAPGEYTIPPINLRCEVQAPSPQNHDPFNDDFFKSFFAQGQAKELSTEAVKIKVLPLPGNKPADFSGAVGRYQISAQLDKNEAEVNSPLTLNLIVKGEGNLKTITCPKLPAQNHFKFYEPTSTVEFAPQGDRMGGELKFTQVIIPLKAGNFTFPALSFSYFDPDKKTYVNIQTQPLAVKVKPGAGNLTEINPAQAAPQPNPTPTQTETKDQLRFIHKQPSPSYSPLERSGWFLPMLLLPWGILLLGLIIKLVMTAKTKNAETTRSSRAYKTARAALQKIKTADCQIMLPQASEIIHQYLEAKFSDEAGGLSLEQLQDFLSRHQASPEIFSALKEILENADCASYAPSQLSEKSAPVWRDKAQQLLIRMEKELK